MKIVFILCKDKVHLQQPKIILMNGDCAIEIIGLFCRNLSTN